MALFNLFQSRPQPTVPPVVRVRQSKSWMPVDKLSVGMYVTELDVPWEETRFMFQGFIIADQATLEELQRVATRARVDTTKLVTVPRDSLSCTQLLRTH